MDLLGVFQKRRPRARYVINSLPKSGTHLLARVFDLLGFRNEPDLTLTHGQFSEAGSPAHRGGSTEERLPVGVTRTTGVQRSELHRRLASVRPGHYVRGHLPYHAEWPRLLDELGFGIVTIVRDPRDVLVSNVDAILKDQGNWLHRHFCQQLTTRDERLAAMIEGTSIHDDDGESSLEPFVIRINKVLPWLEFDGGECFRFEDLVGPEGGGDSANQVRELARLLQSVDPAGGQTSKASQIARKVFGRGSRTFNRGRVGRWRDEFTPAQRERWDTSLANVTVQLGYARIPCVGSNAQAGLSSHERCGSISSGSVH